jgi:hypothetical protein
MTRPNLPIPKPTKADLKRWERIKTAFKPRAFVSTR